MLQKNPKSQKYWSGFIICAIVAALLCEGILGYRMLCPTDSQKTEPIAVYENASIEQNDAVISVVPNPPSELPVQDVSEEEYPTESVTNDTISKVRITRDSFAGQAPASVLQLQITETGRPGCWGDGVVRVSNATNKYLVDDNYLSWKSYKAGDTIHIESDSNIYSLYLQWNTIPGSWELITENGVQMCGQDGFLHEFVLLETPVRTLDIMIPRDNTELSELFGFSDGVPPEFVQIWEPPCQEADILLFSTHVDDEYIFFGGIIPMYGAGRGYHVQVAYLVDHMMQSIYMPRQAFRGHECLNGLWTAGIRNYPVINSQPDVACKSFQEADEAIGADNYLEFQVEQIRRFKPLVVLGHDFDGEYGHGQHIMNAICLDSAIEYACDERMFPMSAQQYGTWDTQKFYAHLYTHGEDVVHLDYNETIGNLGGITAYEAAENAYKQCRSQQRKGHPIYKQGTIYDSSMWGLVRSMVGADVSCNDLMEHTFRANERG